MPSLFVPLVGGFTATTVFHAFVLSSILTTLTVLAGAALAHAQGWVNVRRNGPRLIAAALSAGLATFAASVCLYVLFGYGGGDLVPAGAREPVFW